MACPQNGTGVLKGLIRSDGLRERSLWIICNGDVSPMSVYRDNKHSMLQHVQSGRKPRTGREQASARAGYEAQRNAVEI